MEKAERNIIIIICILILLLFLILLYSKVFGLTKTLIIVLLHTILDNLIMGSFNIYYFPFMFIGWMIIPIIVCLFFKKVDNAIVLAIIGTVCSFVYSWLFAIGQVLLTDVSLLVYLASDFTFEIILAISSFLSILWLYKPCSKLLLKLVD